MEGRDDMLHAHDALTYEDFLALPDDGLRHELIDGAHVVTPSPALRHQRILAVLFRVLDRFVQDHQAGEVLFAPVDVVLSAKDVVVPDLIFVASDQAGLMTERECRGAPALVAEVLSPWTRAHDRTTKRALYERTGIRELWLVDPDARCVEAFRRRAAGRFAGAERVCAGVGARLTTPLLPGLEVPVRDLFVAPPGTRKQGSGDKP
jgi:Uma2 family endonuclease